jgi:histidyl-tRNA synthetase
MVEPIRAPRGTRDVLPTETAAWDRVESIARDLARRYAFERIELPLFERIELFQRTGGETSDIVEKEMFRVSGGAGGDEEREWALRPEPTASVVRAYVEHGLHVRPSPLRLTLIGPMFRYARPQAGRFRQFSQWDCEVIGDAGPLVDAELIELATRFYATCGLHDVVARVNSIGDADCRPGYRQALVRYFSSHEPMLTDESRRRLHRNPLRVLDDKELDPELAAGAPRALDHLCEACRRHFEAVLAMLDRLGCRYEVDHRLVRGLDYYTRTTFEFFVRGREGQQDAVGAGGRYDGLVEELGGRPTPGIGFGIGLDRTMLAMEAAGVEVPPPGPLVVVASADPEALVERLEVAGRLREAGLRVQPDGSPRRLGRQLEGAARLGARWVVNIGEELERGAAAVKDLSTGEQREVALDALADALRP